MQNVKIDEYINHSAEFAKPILLHLREIVHGACPMAEENIKWSFPTFSYNKNILCSMAAFKNHCAFGFWLAEYMKDPAGILKVGEEREGMGNIGKITDVKDLPPDAVLKAYIQQAMELIDLGVKLPRKIKKEKTEINIPDYFKKELKKDANIANNFEALSYSHRKEYIEWITGAKTEETRNRRIAKALALIAEKKSQNWKYEPKNRKA